MPPLDRTAAGLEPCSLRRLMPAGVKPARTLHASIWRHGTAEAEAGSPIWPARDGCPDNSTADHFVLASPLHSSTFLLDFLYPRGTLMYMRKLSAGVLGRRRRATAAIVQGRTALPGNTNAFASSAGSLVHDDAESALPTAANENDAEGQDEPQPPASAKETVVSEKLREMLELAPTSGDSATFDRAWALFNELGPWPLRDELAPRVLAFLARSRRQTEAQRALQIFDSLEPEAWDADAVAGAIKSLLLLRKRPDAVALFRHSLATKDWSPPTPAPGFGLLVASVLQTSSWDLLSQLWADYKQKTGLAGVPAAELQDLAEEANLSELLRRFSDHLGMAVLQDPDMRVAENGENGEDAEETAGDGVEGAAANNEEMLQTASDEQAPAFSGDKQTAEAAGDDQVPKVQASEATGNDNGDNEEVDPEPVDPEREALKALHKSILEASLPRLDPAETFRFVRQLQNPRIYENFIELAVSSKSRELAALAYSEYRLLPRYRPRYSTLVSMVRDVYYPDDARGMENVLRDWYNIHEGLSYWGYQKFLAFYAMRGNVTAVYRLWNEFTEAFPSAIQDGEDTFAHLLKVHAVRGDVAQVEQVFAEIGDKYGVAPNIICWNIRLHMHVERGRYDQAMAVFEALCSAVAPDDYSFGTIMALAGGRGDLNLVLELYGLALEQGVRVTEAMVDPIVEAYCQNDRFAEAERLCLTTTQERAARGAPYTALWNTLLLHHGFRQDLVTVNRLLKTMTRLQVAYDEGTYSALLFGLARCRQPRRALELLRAAQNEGIFRPTAHHYMLLMMAYLRNKQPQRALQVNRLMHHLGFQRSSQQIQMVIKAFSQWQDFPKGYGKEGAAAAAEAAGSSTGPGSGSGSAAGDAESRVDRRELFAKALREFQRSLAGTPDAQALDREAARVHLGAVRRFSFVVFMLAQARDFAGVEEVMHLYRTVVAPVDDDDDKTAAAAAAGDDEAARARLPLKLCNALMLSDYYEGRFDRVKEMWQHVLARTREIATPHSLDETKLRSILGTPPARDAFEAMTHASQQEAQPRQQHQEQTRPAVVAKLRYGLTDPLKTMQRLYAAERDADGLARLVQDDVLASGFALDSKNWNFYVQNLARLGRTAEAFAACERELMGQWSGFAVIRARRPTQAGGAAGNHVQPLTNGGPFQRDSAGSNPGNSRRPSRAQLLRESAPRYNRPMTYTFMVLAKAYMELERAAAWSSAAERQYAGLAVKCPKTVQAVRTMVRLNSRIEGQVFGGGGGGGGGGGDAWPVL